MNKKIFGILAIFLVITLGISSSLVLANNDENTDIPEENGTYDVPGHPEMKVKVFVYKAKSKLGTSVLSAPVCGLTDFDSLAVVDPTGWKLPTGNWTYRINISSVPSSVGSANLSTIAVRAFSVWSNVSNGKINFVVGSPTIVNRARYDGQNIVAWGSASSSALAITYTWYYPRTGLVAEVDTIMNKKFSWSWTNQAVSPNCADANSYDAQDILTHELGHWMGLNDEYTSAYVNNTMYGYGSKAEMKKDTLTTGDINGVIRIY
jgi:hypothetical protein